MFWRVDVQVDSVVFTFSFVNIKATEGVGVEQRDSRLRSSLRVEGKGDSNKIMVR